MARISTANKILPSLFLKELDEIFAQHNRKVFSKLKVIPRDCSTKTRYERAANIRRSFAELFQLGFQLRSPANLKEKHIFALGEYWRKKTLHRKHCMGCFQI